MENFHSNPPCYFRDYFQINGPYLTRFRVGEGIGGLEKFSDRYVGKALKRF